MVNPKNNVVAEAAYTALDASAATPFSIPTAIASSVFTASDPYATVICNKLPVCENVTVPPLLLMPSVGKVIAAVLGFWRMV